MSVSCQFGLRLDQAISLSAVLKEDHFELEPGRARLLDTVAPDGGHPRRLRCDELMPERFEVQVSFFRSGLSLPHVALHVLQQLLARILQIGVKPTLQFHEARHWLEADCIGQKLLLKEAFGADDLNRFDQSLHSFGLLQHHVHVGVIVSIR